VTKIRVAWGITGAGDYLVESVSAMKRVSANLDVEVTVLVSKNAEMVVKWYRLWDDLKSSFEKVKLEKGANVPFIAGPLQVGTYRLFFVSPATVIYPVDQELGSRETQIPGGDTITITTRRIDVENVERITRMEGITVVKHPFEIVEIVGSFAGKETRQDAP
jgi:flavoprotein